MEKSLDRKALLAKEKVEIVTVDLGNGEAVHVRQMSGRDRDRFDQALIEEIKDDAGVVTGYQRSTEDFRAKVAVFSLCDEKGYLLLLPEDIPVLSQNMSSARLEKIVIASQKLNKLSEVEKDLVVKNLDAGQPGNSSSDSAGN